MIYILNEKIRELRIAHGYNQVDFAKNELASFDKVKAIVVGGKTRYESAKIGFSSIDNTSEFVAMHDSARCFVTEDIIKSVIADAIKYGAATAASSVTDTLKVIDSDFSIEATLDRNTVVAVQTPQIFATRLYKEALESVGEDTAKITDDNMLLESIGVKVHCTITDKSNIKLTTEDDIQYANYLLNLEKKNG